MTPTKYARVFLMVIGIILISVVTALLTNYSNTYTTPLQNTQSKIFETITKGKSDHIHRFAVGVNPSMITMFTNELFLNPETKHFYMKCSYPECNYTSEILICGGPYAGYHLEGGN